MSDLEIADYHLDGRGPLFGQIERSIAERILKGQLKPGDKLPPEVLLSGHFKTSRQTVNKAISELAKHGLVVRRRRAGTLVCANFQERFVLPISDISENVTAQGQSYEFEVTERTVVANGRAGIHWTELPADSRLLYLECIHFASGQPIQFERRYISIDAVPSVEDEPFTDVSPGRWLTLHVPWSSVRHRLKAINVTEDLARKLGVQPGAACMQVERTTLHLGQPVTLAYLTHPGDRFELTGVFNVAGTSDINGVMA